MILSLLSVLSLASACKRPNPSGSLDNTASFSKKFKASATLNVNVLTELPLSDVYRIVLETSWSDLQALRCVDLHLNGILFAPDFEEHLENYLSNTTKVRAAKFFGGNMNQIQADAPSTDPAEVFSILKTKHLLNDIGLEKCLQMLLSKSDFIRGHALLDLVQSDMGKSPTNWHLLFSNFPSIAEVVRDLGCMMMMVAYIGMIGIMRLYGINGARFGRAVTEYVGVFEDLSSFVTSTLCIDVEKDLVPTIFQPNLAKLLSSLRSFFWIHPTGVVYGISFLAHVDPKVREKMSAIQRIIMPWIRPLVRYQDDYNSHYLT